MTSTTDIKTGGGTCEYVATDFWECTDKDGKKWWCSEGGKTCVPKPLRGRLSWREEVFHATMELYLLPDESGGYVVTTPVGGRFLSQEGTRSGASKEHYERLAGALRWVADTPAVQKAAVRAAQTKNLTVPDSMLADPTVVIAGAEAALAGARKQGAPEDVVATLEDMVARYRTGAERLPRLDYTVRTLRGLQGMRDRSELEGPLSEALANAPDETNRAKLTQIAALVRRPRSFDVGFPALDDDLGVSCDWGCCAFACILCEAGCAVCCAAACLLC
jgi:hypothetical protein